MIKRCFLVVFAAIGLSSCLDDNVDSDTTKLGKEQEKIMVDYIAKNNLTAQKQALYSRYNDYFPVYTMIATKGDTITQVAQNAAIWTAYTIRTLDNKVVQTVTKEDSVLLYADGYSGKILGLGVCAATFLGIGGKGSFLIPSSLGYGNKPPGGIESNAILILDIEVVGRLNEAEQIAFYIKKNNFKTTETTSTGLIYSQLTTTTDSLVASATSAKVTYKGSFMNGYVFDPDPTKTTTETTTETFTLTNLVPGFSEAVKKMRIGEKAKVIIPSSIAYGQDGSGRMPWNMALVFEIEVLDKN